MALNRTPQRSDNSINFSQYREMANDVNRNNNINFDTLSFNVIKDNSGTYVSALISPEVEVIPEEFGKKSIAGTTLTIYGGSIVVGSVEYTVGDTALGISSDCYVGYEFDIVAKTLGIVNFGSAVAQDDSHIRQKLYHITYNSGTTPSITIDKDCHKSVSYPALWGTY